MNTNEKLNLEDNNSYNEDINSDNSFKNTSRLIKWLINNNLSCYYDSFYTIFVFNIVNIIKKNENIISIDNDEKKIIYENFKYIIDFCIYLKQNIGIEHLNFFDLYLNYQKIIGANFLLINESEIGDINSVPICYRPLYDIDFFIFKYNIKHNCNGICKFANTVIETKFTGPFLEFTENYLNDKNIINPGNFIENGYFKNRNVLCNELECINENIGNVQNFRYDILNFPLFLSIYIPFEYDKLKQYHHKLKIIFAKDFKLKGLEYNLIGIILMESHNHFIVVFKNIGYFNNYNGFDWLYHDDLNGYIKPLDYLGFQNIINSYYFNLFIYTKLKNK